MTDLCRRSLFRGAAAAWGTGLLTACAGSAGSAALAPSQTAGGTTASAPAGKRAALAQLADIPVGGAISVEAPDGGNVLLTQPAAGEVKAFSAACPHEGCNAAPDGESFACPCHGSRFGLDGSVQQGPAGRALTAYAVEVVNGQVLSA